MKKISIIIFSIIILFFCFIAFGSFSFFKAPYTNKEVKNTFEKYLEEKYPNEKFEISKINHIFNESDFIHKYETKVTTKYNGKEIEFSMFTKKELENINDDYLKKLNDKILYDSRLNDINNIFEKNMEHFSISLYIENLKTLDLKEQILKIRNPEQVLVDTQYPKGYIIEETRIYLLVDKNKIYDKDLLYIQLKKLKEYYENKDIEFKSNIELVERYNNSEFIYLNNFEIGSYTCLDEKFINNVLNK